MVISTPADASNSIVNNVNDQQDTNLKPVGPEGPEGPTEQRLEDAADESAAVVKSDADSSSEEEDKPTGETATGSKVDEDKDAEDKEKKKKKKKEKKDKEKKDKEDGGEEKKKKSSKSKTDKDKDGKDKDKKEKKDKDKDSKDSKEKKEKKSKKTVEDDLADLMKPQDMFAQVDPFNNKNDVDGGPIIHIRVQQRNGRKMLTTIQGLPKTIDQKDLLKELRRKYACNGTIILDPEMGEVIQLQGKLYKEIHSELSMGKCKGMTIRSHGF